MRFLWVVTFSLVAGSAVLPAHESTARSHDIANFFSGSEQPLHEYRAFRRMHAAGEGGKHEAWLEASTELKAARFSYHIASQKRSAVARGKLPRPMPAPAHAPTTIGAPPHTTLTPPHHKSTT